MPDYQKQKKEKGREVGVNKNQEMNQTRIGFERDKKLHNLRNGDNAYSLNEDI